MVVFDFGYYISKGVVKRKRVDISLAESLLKAAKDRFDFAKIFEKIVRLVEKELKS
jgi:hypothetical protein